MCSVAWRRSLSSLRLDLTPWAVVNGGCDDAGECLVLGDREVVDPADRCPAARVAQDHPVVAGEVLTRCSVTYVTVRDGRSSPIPGPLRQAMQANGQEM